MTPAFKPQPRIQTHRRCHNIPGLIPSEPLEVEQDALQLDDGEGRVGIIELDSDLVGELGPSALRLLEAPDDVIKRGGHPEILLL